MSKSIGRLVSMPKHHWHRLPFAFKDQATGARDAICHDCGLLRRTRAHGFGAPHFRHSSFTTYFRNGIKLGHLAGECPGERLRHHA